MTLKTSRHFVGTPIHFRTVCTLEGRHAPLSLRGFNATSGNRSFSGQLSTGDVTCTWAMALWQNGFWSLVGDFHYSGPFFSGAFFSADFLLDSNASLGTRLKGSILDPQDTRQSFQSLDGIDPWIRENWFRFEASGPSVHLRASTAIGVIVESSLEFLLIVVGVVQGASTVKDKARRLKFTLNTSDPPPDGTLAGIDVGDAADGPEVDA